MHTLILNLTRFGDLLQTQPAISGLAAAGNSVGLVCLDNFSGAAALLQDLDCVHSLPGARLLAALERDWRAASAELVTWGRQIVTTRAPDPVTNLTATLSVRLLARALAESSLSANAQTPRCQGFLLDELGFGLSSNSWVAFLLASSRYRGLSPFNLVDLFWKACELGSGPRPFALRQPDAERREQARALLAQAGPAPASRGLVGFQLGASENRRRWPLEHFAALGRLLDQAGLTPVLLGSDSERELAARYLAAGAPGLDLTGRTSLPELAAVLSQVRLLVSNDTGTMHLAAGLGRPVVGIFLATAQPWDTGPYQPGNICLEPDLDCHPCSFSRPCAYQERCRRRIAPETVLQAVQTLLGVTEGRGCATGDARIWRTRVEEDQFMGLESLSGHEQEERTQWIRLQRHIYRHFLDRTPIPAPPSFAFGAGFRASVSRTLDDSRKLLTLLAGQGQALLAGARIEPLKQKFMASWQRLQGLWDADERLAVLGHLWLSESQEAGRQLETFLPLIDRYQALTTSWLEFLGQADQPPPK